MNRTLYYIYKRIYTLQCTYVQTDRRCKRTLVCDKLLKLWHHRERSQSYILIIGQYEKYVALCIIGAMEVALCVIGAIAEHRSDIGAKKENTKSRERHSEKISL